VPHLELYAKNLTQSLLKNFKKKSHEGTEWNYTPQLAKRAGWKQLYVDALVSKKLEKEFTFGD